MYKNKLKKIFGHDTLYPFQKQAIEASLRGEHILLTIPTGGGKSLCFQLPAVIKDGLSIVISPLLSLIENQIQYLREKNIGVVVINSTTKDLAKCLEKIKPSSCENIKLLYTTPETLSANQEIKDSLQVLYKHNKLNYLIIDEVHCLSEWGHDFRPSYLFLQKIRSMFDISCIACTATATPLVEYDIKRILNIPNMRIVRKSFYRNNLNISIYHCKNDKLMQIGKLVRTKYRHSCGIVYHTTRKNTEMTASYLANVCGVSAKYYHAGINSTERSKIQKEWESGDINIIVATIAFGMGIDKSNVRFVIHGDLPKSISDYYQGIGRAGRDGESSDVIMFYSKNDYSILSRMIMYGKVYNNEKFKNEKINDLKEMLWFAQNPYICRHQLLCSQFGERLFDICKTHCDNCISLKKQKKKSKKINITTICSSIFKLVLFLGNHNHRRNLKYWLFSHDDSNDISILKNVANTTYKKELLELRGIFSKFEDWQYYHIISYLIIKKYMFEEIKVNRTVKHSYPLFRMYKKCKAVMQGTKKVYMTVLEPKIWSNIYKEPFEIKKSKVLKVNNEVTFNPLYKQLTYTRKVLADEFGVYELYRIASNKSIEDMVKLKPKTKKELLKCSGIGKIRMSKYGNQFIECIKAYENANPRSLLQ